LIERTRGRYRVSGGRRRVQGYLDKVTSVGVPTAQEVHVAYREELGPRERSALWSWVGFTTTFAAVRAITYSIRRGDGPFGNVRLGGEHLHHYMWGIAMVSGVGAVAIAGEERARQHPAAALTYGAGLALIIDEFALLLDLKDVYWAKQGRISIDLGVGLVALGGSVFSAIPVFSRLLNDRRLNDRQRSSTQPGAAPRPLARADRWRAARLPLPSWQARWAEHRSTV
jgi:hypothetical protein